MKDACKICGKPTTTTKTPRYCTHCGWEELYWVGPVGTDTVEFLRSRQETHRRLLRGLSEMEDSIAEKSRQKADLEEQMRTMRAEINRLNTEDLQAGLEIERLLEKQNSFGEWSVQREQLQLEVEELEAFRASHPKRTGPEMTIRCSFVSRDRVQIQVDRRAKEFPALVAGFSQSPGFSMIREAGIVLPVRFDPMRDLRKFGANWQALVPVKVPLRGKWHVLFSRYSVLDPKEYKATVITDTQSFDF